MNLNRMSRWRLGAGALLTGIVLLVACDGSNLFDNEQNPFITPRLTLSVPDGAFAGDTIGIAVSATAANDISSIDISVRGAVSRDTTLTVTGRSVSATFKVALPEILTDTLLFVTAVARDINGNVSRTRTDTVSVLGPPSIISVNGPDSLSLGATQTITVRAFGARRIAQFDVTVRGALNEDRTISVVPPLNDVTQAISFQIPAAVPDTALRISIVAKDITGLSSRPVAVTVPIRISGPTVSLTAPANVSPGSSLDLTVQASAMRQVQRIRIVTTGAVIKDTTITVNPTAINVTQPVSIRIPGDATGGAINVTAFAIDRAGTSSAASAVRVVALNTGLPVINSVTCTNCSNDSIRAGRTVDIRVVATGVAPIKSLEVRFRGAVDQLVTVAITPSATNVTRDVSVAIPVEVTDTSLTVTAVAVDEANNRSAITGASTLRLSISDVTVPVVSATATPAATTAGSRINIRVNARDNVSVTRIGYAVLNPAGDTINLTPTLVPTSGAVKDTTFSFLVPLTITPRTVRVLGIAQDASGRRGYSTAVSVVVADSAAPAIIINAPTPNSTLPLNDSVRVNIRVTDPTGIKTIRLRGESVRIDSLGPTRTIQRFAEKIITFPFTPGAPLPTDTTITRYLLAIPDSISEPVSIIVTASDSLNNTASTSVSILVGGPRIELRNPTAGAQVVPGGTLLLSAFAVDRSAGIDSVLISITGAQTASFKFPPCPPGACSPVALPSNDSVLINQNYVVGPATGLLTITATAWNRNRVAGVSNPVSVVVSTTAVTDALPPNVRVAMTINDRIELSDTIALNVAAQDVGAAGLRRMGVVVIATPGGTGVAPDTLYRDSVFSGTGRTGLQPASFKFTLADFGYTEQTLIRLPRNMTFQVHAFAVDTAGNVGCSVSNTMTALPCDSIMPAQNGTPRVFYIARNSGGLTQLVTVVPGFAVPLPNAASRIADLVVDMNPARPRMYLSNHNFNRLEVLSLTDSTFAPPVTVGSEPWGLFVNNANNRLMVANSGGTNISMVDITQPINSIAEVAAERILTPNASLFDVTRVITTSATNYLITVHDFSDRPQFVAQDANGTILHSTKPTGAAPDGSVRYLVPMPGSPRPFESKILFTDEGRVNAIDFWAIAHIDSIGNGITLYDHVPGNPAAVISATDPDIDVAIANLRLAGSDIDARSSARWNLESVGLSDTTYVATSTDRQFVGFGEGATGPFASIWLWHCAPVTAACSGGQGPGPGTLTDDIEVDDLIGNAAERVLGIALNSDGRLGGARGAQSAYYFSNDIQAEGDLRLQGVFSNGVAGGGGGIALHPSHVYSTAGSTNVTLSFVATAFRSIKIIDTFSFTQRGEILIRDNITGPLRAALPLPAENVGLVGTCNEIIVKLYGITGAGRAVIINVRARDISSPALTGYPACPAG
jgi:hypothetical protein